MERIYPAYKKKIEANTKLATSQPDNFAKQLNLEYAKYRKSKAKQYIRLDKLPVRIYGSGDYHPVHFEWMRQVDFKFYIISKTLTIKIMEKELDKLLELDKLTNVVLSFDKENIKNYDNVKHLFNKDRISFAYTGGADEFNSIKTSYNFDIFFNISDKKVEKQKSRLIKEQCPCDSGALKHNESCSFCNKCWRSSHTKQPNWNN